MRDYHYTELPPAVRLRKTLRILKRAVGTGMKLLDVGCGDATAISSVGRGKLFGLDISYNILEMAPDSRDSKLVQGTGGNIPFGAGVFDVVTCLEVLEHVRNPRKVLKEIKRVVKRGGYVLLSVPVASYWRIIKSRLRGRREEYLDELEHITEFTRIRLKRFVPIKRLLGQIKSTGFGIRSISGCYYIPDFLDGHANRLTKRFPRLGGLYSKIDVAAGHLPHLRYLGRYLFIECWDVD